MKLTLRVVIALLLATPIIAAQTRDADEVRLNVAGFAVEANGAEVPAGVSRGVGSLRIGEPTVGVFSMWGCGHFSVAVPPASFHDNATAGWRVEVTPLKVVDHAVTFRLRWARALDKGGSFGPAPEDVEVTLKPGESRPIDTVTIDQKTAKTIDGRPCDTKTASLRVSADFIDLDRRLVGADLWLVDRSAAGQERIQSQSVRGLFNRPIPFYFDRVTDGPNRVDIFGTLIAGSAEEGFTINLEAVRAVPNPDQERGYQAARWFRSTLHIKANEVVEVALPTPDDKREASADRRLAFADRRFSIRIKPRQIR